MFCSWRTRLEVPTLMTCTCTRRTSTGMHVCQNSYLLYVLAVFITPSTSDRRCWCEFDINEEGQSQVSSICYVLASCVSN